VIAKLTLVEEAAPAAPATPDPELLAFVDALADLAADLYLAGRLLVPADIPDTSGGQIGYDAEHDEDRKAHGGPQD